CPGDVPAQAARDWHPAARRRLGRRPVETMAMAGQFRLDDQVALVTGAAGGLGAAISRALAAAGANVALAELPGRLADAERLAQEIAAAHGVRALGVAMDVTALASIEA